MAIVIPFFLFGGISPAAPLGHPGCQKRNSMLEAPQFRVNGNRHDERNGVSTDGLA
jgi:hypothetical protein